jgi:hypothetical protein
MSARQAKEPSGEVATDDEQRAQKAPHRSAIKAAPGDHQANGRWDVTADEYLAILRERLAVQFNLESSRFIAGNTYPLYAYSKLEANKYILHRKIAYERFEVYEHVLCRVSGSQTTPEEISSFVAELRGAVRELVRPSSDHMSTAMTGVLVAERGFQQPAVERLTKAGFNVSFWFGLQGWCYLRLLGVDLATGEVWANRRGKEVMSAYRPGTALGD